MPELETCWLCDEPTGRAGKGDDSLYNAAGNGPYCESCWDGHVIPASPNPAPANRDRELAEQYSVRWVSYGSQTEMLEALSAQARREGREEAMQAIRYERDHHARHCHSDVRAGMDRALAAIFALDQPAPEGEKP